MEGRSRSSSISSLVADEPSEREMSDRVMSSSTVLPSHRSVKGMKHNSVVAAMLASNSLRDCSQVEDMVSKCVAGKDQAFMCQTAQRYFAKCSSSGI